MKGIIIKGIGGFYYIKAEDGQIYECKARGIFRKDKITPTIGDKVEIQVKNGKGNIEKIEKRSTCLIRPPVANINKLVIVVAAASPDPSLFLIDKLLVNAEKNHIEPVICINKTDLAQRTDIVQIYQNAGYVVIQTCAEKDENLDALLVVLKGNITAFAGLSGVGKSSLLNNITSHTMETGTISDKIQRGRHTTRHVELIELDCGGFVLDTPGFSSFEVEAVKFDELDMYFPEIERHKGCRFRGCSHLSEPDCGVRMAYENGEIPESRYESYRQLYEQLKSIKAWE